MFPFLRRHPDLLVDHSEAWLFRAQRSRPWVVSFGAAAILGYLVGPVIAIPLFAWMIAYHAATSEGLHANRIARLFSPGSPGRTAGTEGERADPRSESSAHEGDSVGRPEQDPENRNPRTHVRRGRGDPTD